MNTLTERDLDFTQRRRAPLGALAEFHTTSTGLTIGIAHQRPAAPMGAEAERIQAALLLAAEPARRMHAADRLVMRGCAVIGAALAVLWWIGLLPGGAQ